MNKKIVDNVLIIIIIVVSLTIGLLSFNIKATSKDNKYTTTKKITEVVEDVKEDTIVIEGIIKTLYLKEYTALNIFKINYDVTLFEVVSMSDNSYIIKNINDENTFIKIEESEYSSLDNDEEINENEKIKYIYLSGEKKSLKITRQVTRNDLETELTSIMDYMINTIYVN